MKRLIFKIVKWWLLRKWRLTDKPRYTFYMVHVKLKYYGSDLAYTAARAVNDPNKHRVNYRVPISDIKNINKKGVVKLRKSSKCKLSDLTK